MSSSWMLAKSLLSASSFARAASICCEISCFRLSVSGAMGVSFLLAHPKGGTPRTGGQRLAASLRAPGAQPRARARDQSLLFRSEAQQAQGRDVADEPGHDHQRDAHARRRDVTV